MNRIVLSAGLVTGAFVVADHYLQLRARIVELEQAPRANPDHLRDLERRIGSLQLAVVEARASIEADARTEKLAGELLLVAGELERERCRVAEQSARLDGWESRLSQHAPEQLDGRIEDLSVDVQRREQDLSELRALTERISAEGAARVGAIEARVAPLLGARDELRMWSELVGPVVQLAGESTVGSGVLLESKRRQSGEGWVTHLITSWHVVRDIYGSLDRVHTPVPVQMYASDGSTRDETAHMVAYDVEIDIALLEMDLNEPVPCGARLAPRERLTEMQIFDEVYAVGCPLGNDPIPTRGEIAATHHLVDGHPYWMISAPTYIGNSGGGIFSAGERELVGIFSKIYTHGATRSTIVPHMGLATPLPIVYDWLERDGFSVLVGLAPQAQTASAQR